MAAIGRYEVHPGILTFPEPIALEYARNPASLLDFDEGARNCDLILASINTPRINENIFRVLIAEITPPDATMTYVDVEKGPFGVATHLRKRVRILLRYDDLRQTPYNFTINLFGDEHSALRQLVGADKWIHNIGALQASYPLWEDVSTPAFTVFGTGAKGSFGHELHKFGLLYYVEIGKVVFTVVPKGTSKDTLYADLRTNIHGAPLPQVDTSCDNFPQHESLHVADDYLVEHFNAKTVEVAAGQAIFMQAGVHYQTTSLEPGLSVSFNLIPSTWLLKTPDTITECEHVLDQKSIPELNKVREMGQMFRSYAGRLLEQQNASNGVYAIIDLNNGTYNERAANIHDVMGDNAPPHDIDDGSDDDTNEDNNDDMDEGDQQKPGISQAPPHEAE